MNQKTPSRARTLAFLVSGLVDCIFGGVLLLYWLGFLPPGLLDFGITTSLAGVIGALLTLSGLVVVAFQVSKLREPGE